MGYSEANQPRNDSWEKFRDVGAALQACVPETREEFCIVTLPSHGVWAVGVENKAANRYYACRVALAILLVSQSVEDGDDVNLDAAPGIEALVKLYRENAENPEIPAPPPPKRFKQEAAIPSEPIEIIDEVVGSAHSK